MPGAPEQGLPVLLEIVVPAFNEAERLPLGLSLLTRKAAVLPLTAAILVVDNASTDETADIVRDWPIGPVPVRLLRCEQRGKGAAVRTGLLATRAPYIGFCDADMATDLAAMDLVIRLLATGHRAIIGSRAHRRSVVEARHNWFRTAGAAIFRGLARTVVEGATDTQCGFKFFSGPLARAAAARMRAAGFAFDVELIARCVQLGASITEIPVSWRDVPGSTFCARRHSAGALREIASIWLTLNRRQEPTDGQIGPHHPLSGAGDEPIMAISAGRTRWQRFHSDDGPRSGDLGRAAAAIHSSP